MERSSLRLLVRGRVADAEAEWSVHDCGPAMQRELKHVFPDVSARVGGLRAVLVCQRSHHDLVCVGEEVDAEKDRCLERVRPRRPRMNE